MQSNKRKRHKRHNRKYKTYLDAKKKVREGYKCNKVYYAEVRLAKIGMRRNKHGPELYVYKCPECSGYHLTRSKRQTEML